LQFTLPESIHQELDELVVARQHTDPEATVTHVLEHAIMSYLSSHGALPKAWKEEKKRAGKQDSAPAHKDVTSAVQRAQEDVSQSSGPSTTSVSSSYAKPVQTPAGLPPSSVSSSPSHDPTTH
jgi:cobalamin biosynthesis Mg chelatase CobN